MKDLLERVGDKFTVGDDCWPWEGARTEGGYGHIRHEGRDLYAHRVLYELLVGPIDSGLQIDHLCRNRACVRPSHLEAVTMRENLDRGEGSAATNRRKTHCKHGHEFSPENTYRLPSRPDRRYCIACRPMYDRARRRNG